MLISEFFDSVYVPRRLRGKSQKTIRLYGLTIKQFGRSLGKLAELSDLTEDNVLAHLARRHEVAPATRNKELSQLIAIWRLAAQRKLIDTWPDLQAEDEPERAPIAWLDNELTRLLAAAARMPRRIGKIPQRVYWTLLIRLILDTGERSGAIRQTEWSWFQGEWLFVPAESRKGKTRDRRYRLSKETLTAIAAMRESSTDKQFVFPWPFSESYFWVKYRAVVKEAGLPTSRNHQLHCLRKTTASAVYAAGLDPQEALDHSDKRTTRRYLDKRFTRSEQPCDVLAIFLANPTRSKPADPPAASKSTKTG